MEPKQLFYGFILGLFFFSSGCTYTCPDGSVVMDSSQCPLPQATIANWNVQILGDSKESNSALMDFYADTMDEYDIVFVQEIRDADASSFHSLCSRMPEYSCNISSRAGRSSSKEQVGIIYRSNITLVSLQDFNPDALDRWERPPIKATFDIEGYTLHAYNIHTKPDDVPAEMGGLESVVVDSGNVIILGDLNADCSYYPASSHTHFLAWNWIIQDDADTTVGATDCAYDRIIMNADAYSEFADYGIFTQGINSSVSDHYLVWARIAVVEG